MPGSLVTPVIVVLVVTFLDLVVEFEKDEEE